MFIILHVWILFTWHRQQCEELKNENAILRTQLQQHGIIPDISGTGTCS
jgi:hypothetical protein